MGVGLVSGAKIVDILKKNTDMDPEKYEMICGAPASQFVTLTVLGLFESHEEGRLVGDELAVREMPWD